MRPLTLHRFAAARSTPLAAALLFACAALAPGAARAIQADGGPDYRGSFSLGAGSAHGVFGANAEFGRGRWAGYFGLGLPHVFPAAGVSAGARFFGGEGRGLVVSLGVSYLTIEDSNFLRGALADWGTGPMASARIGWRLRAGWVSLELGAGPALVRKGSSATTEARWGSTFDVDLGLGFEL